jgi:hypothetical protein
VKPILSEAAIEMSLQACLVMLLPLRVSGYAIGIIGVRNLNSELPKSPN